MKEKNAVGNVKKMFNDLLFLFFPEVCTSCNRVLVTNEKVLCTICKRKLPKTNYHLWKDNPMEKHFWGRVNFERASAFYYFRKETGVQQLLHQLKYKGRDDIGVFLGHEYGNELKSKQVTEGIDFIVPVPLHTSRERTRGFNQAYKFGQGISEATNIPIRKDFLWRAVASSTQTKKTRFERWKNVGEIFRTKKENELHGKHLLLVDDVMTTGSTIEACSRALLNATDVKLSVATIAVAM